MAERSRCPQTLVNTVIYDEWSRDNKELSIVYNHFILRMICHRNLFFHITTTERTEKLKVIMRIIAHPLFYHQAVNMMIY